MKSKAIIRTQYFEWYGDEDHVGEAGFGRHKAKGGAEFIVEMDDMVLMYLDTEAFAEKFNATHNKLSNFCRYEFRSIEPYYAPQQVSIDADFNVTI